MLSKSLIQALAAELHQAERSRTQVEHFSKRFAVSKSEEVTAALKEIAEAGGGKLDILVNNAGISKDMLLLRFKDEDWHQVLNTNLASAFFCSRAAAKFMTRARWGRIMAISSSSFT